MSTTALPAPAALPELKLWLLDLRAEPEAALWAACDPEERDRATRFKYEVHARRFRAAHAAMRQAMAQQLGVTPGNWRWTRGLLGKPHPVFRGWGQFNLSHSEDWGLLAWHPRCPVGIDIEWCKPLPDRDSVAAQQYTASELTWMSDGDDATRTHRFYQLWSAKEAVLKALGSGLLVTPNRFTLDVTTFDEPPAAPSEAGLTHLELGEADDRTPGTVVPIAWAPLPLPEGLVARAAVAWLDPEDQWHAW